MGLFSRGQKVAPGKGGWHINGEGRVGSCNATKIPCRYASFNHFPTEQAAQEELSRRKAAKRQQVKQGTGYAADAGTGAPVARQVPATTAGSTPLVAGETPRVRLLRENLDGMARALKQYEAYRATGLNEHSMVPPVPEVLAPYVMDKKLLTTQWMKRDYASVVRTYREAYKRDFMRSGITPEDVDSLPGDGELEDILWSHMPAGVRSF